MKEGNFIMVIFFETFQNMLIQMATNGFNITQKEVMIQLFEGLILSW